MLTLEDLKEMAPGRFAGGVIDDPRLYKDGPVRWVAVRGGIEDWALYYHHAGASEEFVMSSGDKCFTPQVIRDLVPCEDDAYNMYRY